METGGAGFLGFHLCHQLFSMGHEAVSVDIFSTILTYGFEYEDKDISREMPYTGILDTS